MNSQSLVAIWNMIWELVGHIRVPSGKTPAQLRTDPETQMALINASRAHLENEYFNFIQETVNSNLRDANRGAMPGTEQLIRSFLQVRKVSFTFNYDFWVMIFSSTTTKRQKMEMSGLWFIIACDAVRPGYDFYCLLWISHDWTLDCRWNRQKKLADRRRIPSKPRRLGRITRQTSRTQPRVEDQDPIPTLSARVYRSVQAGSLLHCRQVRHWHSRGRDSEDGWLLVDEALASCCWKGKFLALKVEGFQLIFQTGDGYESIEKFQRDILEEYGEAHFQADQSPLLYFNVLVLTGQFEAAIEFLAR